MSAAGVVAARPPEDDAPLVARWVGAGLLLVLVTAPWPHGSVGRGPRFVLAAALLALCAAWAVDRAVRGRGMPAVTLAAAALPTVGLLQLAFGSTVAPARTAEAVVIAAAILGALVVWSDGRPSPGAMMRLASAVLVLCAAQGVFGVLQSAWGPPASVYGVKSAVITLPFGSYVSHNHFAGLTEMGALLALGLALGQWRRRNELAPPVVLLAGLSLALVATHLASRSRGGLLALSAGLLAFVIAAWPGAGTRKQMLGGAAALVTVLGLGLAMISGSAREYLQTVLTGTGGSGRYRIDIAQATLSAARARPWLGSGMGTFEDAAAPYKRAHGDVRSVHAEGDVIEWLCEAGLLGLLAVAAVGYGLWPPARSREARRRDAVLKGAAVGASAGVVALLAHSLLDFNLRIPANALVFVSLLALCGAGRPHRREVGGRLASTAAAMILILLTIAAAWLWAGAIALEKALGIRDADRRLVALTEVLQNHPYSAEAFHARGMARRTIARGAFADARRDLAIGDLQRAIAWRPSWGRAWYDLAETLYLTGRAAEAAAALARAGELDPSHLQLGLARAFLAFRLHGAAAGVTILGDVSDRNARLPRAVAIEAAGAWTRDRKALETLVRTAEDRLALDRVAPPGR